MTKLFRPSLHVGFVGLVLAAVCGSTKAGAQRNAAPKRAVRALTISAPTRPLGDLRARFAAAVAHAESEGARHPRQRDAGALTTRRCVDATAPARDLGGVGSYTSGEFTAGPFAMYAETWPQGGGKLWWEPRHVDTSTTLVVTARPLDHVGDVYTLRKRGMARTLVPDRQTYFYATMTRLPRRGVWLIVATAGEDWGCFLYAF